MTAPDFDMAPLCECGRRLGLHRWGDLACPNPHWKTGNGQPQWWQRSFRAAALSQDKTQVDPWTSGLASPPSRIA